MHIAKTALKRYNLHAIWWMVSPQNPLKSRHNSFSKRLKMTRKFARHPRMVATDIESHLGTQYTLQSVSLLKKRFPKTRFVWIAGMDNAAIFHRWDGWKTLLGKIPFVFFHRPPHRTHVSANITRLYRGRKTVTYCLKGKTRNISSTELRQKGFVHFLKSALYLPAKHKG